MTEHPVKRRKKLIEVAIPLEAINAASAREKSIRHGHPSTLHLWWARRPLAAARAVIFCQMVDDPSAVPEEFPTEEDQENERLRLFSLISELVTWENTTNEEVLDRAREEIRRSWRRCCTDNADHPDAIELFNPEKLPGFHDPFAGGGALPLEAQRLGLESYASDLNPVAVLINKAMIEIPPKFAGKEPINPFSENKKILIGNGNQCAKNLADDVRFYGEWIRNEAQKRIGHFYPKARITEEIAAGRSDLQVHIGEDLEVISWIWARTVSSPNPAFSHIKVPLASTFFLSSQRGKEAYVQPVITSEGYEFEIRTSRPEEPDKVKNGTKSGGSHSEFLCLMSGTPMPFEYLRRESREGRMGCKLMAIVVMAGRKRLYIPPIQEHEELALDLSLDRGQKTDICHWPGRTNVVEYGIEKFEDLYTDRQFLALSCFSSLVLEARDLARKDALKTFSHAPSEANSSEDISEEAKSYADAIATYLGITVSKAARFITTLSVWRADEGKLSRSFGRQAIPMTWDFAETNPFSSTGGDIKGLADGTADSLEKFSICM